VGVSVRKYCALIGSW